MQLALQAGSKKECAKAVAAMQPSHSTAPGTDITAVSAGVALSEANKLLLDSSNAYGAAVQRGKDKAASWVQQGKQRAGKLQGFKPAIAGLEPRLSDSSDAPYSPKIAAARSILSRMAACGSSIVACLDNRASGSKCSPAAEGRAAAHYKISRQQHAKSRLQQRRPPPSPFAAIAAE